MASAAGGPSEPDGLIAEYTHSRMVHLGSGSFVEYCVCIRRGDLVWQVWHRYSDWLSFRKSLLARRIAAARPPLPSKTRSSHGVGHDVTSKRGPALAAWLTGVLADTTALADPHVLGATCQMYAPTAIHSATHPTHYYSAEFAGLLSHEPAGRSEGANSAMPPIHARTLASHARTGDVMLFRTKAAMPALQRAVTFSSWDHVGLIVHLDRYGKVCESGRSVDVGVVESDVNGCHYYSVADYLERRWHLAFERVAIRRLTCEKMEETELAQALDPWYHDVIGRRYNLVSISKISRALGGKDSTEASEGFFCSELLAHAYKVVGLLPADAPASTYLPVSFTDGSGLVLENGASLGPEVPVEFSTPGARSRRVLGDFLVNLLGS